MSDAKPTAQEFLDAAQRGDSETVKAGLDAGLKPDTADAHENTALMKACARGQRDIVDILVDAGANPEHKNKFGLGPRDWTEWAENQGPIRSALG